jgi:uncharacterized protein YndB with AHSA1/START domain
MTERQIVKTIHVAASPEEAWGAWATVDGVKTFFGPAARIELRPGGPYEIYFSTDAPEGLRGSEGCKLLSFVPSEMISFTWNAPPEFPKSRREIAQWVVVSFRPNGDGTLVKLVELGWKEGDEGEAVYRYFDRAWTTVLARLAHSFSEGPVDWKNPYQPSNPNPA